MRQSHADDVINAHTLPALPPASSLQITTNSSIISQMSPPLVSIWPECRISISRMCPPLTGPLFNKSKKKREGVALLRRCRLLKRRQEVVIRASLHIKNDPNALESQAETKRKEKGEENKIMKGFQPADMSGLC